MAALLFILLLPYSLADLGQGSLGGYLNSTEIGNMIVNLTQTFPSLFTMPVGASFLTLQLSTSIPTPNNNQKPAYLILGGFYAGYPQSAYEVLYLADRLADEYMAGNQSVQTFVNASTVLFLPILNMQGYQLMEKNYTGGQFLVVETGLEGALWSCSSYDAGVNADRSFSYGWAQNTNCSLDYGGKAPLESANAKQLDGLITSVIPQVIVNFQGPGSNIYIPYSSKPDSLSQKALWYYDVAGSSAPNGWNIRQKYDTATNSGNGTLLDYGFSLDAYTLEIGMGDNTTVPSTQITSTAAGFYDYVLRSFLEDSLYVAISFSSVYEKVNTGTITNSSYYSEVSFTFTIQNIRALDFSFNLIFDPGFDKPEGYQMYLAETVTNTNYDNNTQVLILNYAPEGTNGTAITIAATSVGYSIVNLTVAYYRLSSDSSGNYNATASFNTDNQKFYYDLPALKKSGSVSDNEEDSNDGGPPIGRKPMLTGLVLLIVLLVLLLISGIVLCCTRTRKEEVPNFFPSAEAIPPQDHYGKENRV